MSCFLLRVEALLVLLIYGQKKLLAFVLQLLQLMCK